MCEIKGNCYKGCGYPERRWLQFLILMSVCEKPTYGYELIKSIEEFTLGRHIIKSGTMYTTLRRMERGGLLKSDWKQNKSGPDSREYKITEKGESYLKAWLEMMVEKKRMIDKMAEFYDHKFRSKKNEL
jgi:PadR family transcriptional regulator, regulatory protein PadR